MVLIGHSVADQSGRLIAMDDAVAAFLHRSMADVIGLSYLDVTHPDDQPSNISRIAGLSLGDAAVPLRKRYIRPGGEIAWAGVRVSKMQIAPDEFHIVGTIFELDFTKPQAPPERLWRAARLQRQQLTARCRALGADLFRDNAWAILLNLYIAEAEGRPMILDDQLAELGISPNSLRLWLKALRSSGLAEYRQAPLSHPQLTQRGLDQIEQLLQPGTEGGDPA